MLTGARLYVVLRNGFRFLFLLVLIVINPLCFIPAAAGEYNLVTTNLPPWSIDGNNGIFPDIVREIEKRLGSANVPSVLPWTRAQYYTQNNDDYLIFPFTRTAEREEDFTWVVEVMLYEMRFISIGGDPIDLETARGLHSVLVHQNAPPYFYLFEKGFQNLNPRPFGAEPLMKMLAVGRADAWFTDGNFAKFAALGTSYATKLIFGPPAVTRHLYIAGSKNIDPEIVSAFREQFEQLKAEGVVDDIISKYVGE